MVMKTSEPTIAPTINPTFNLSVSCGLLEGVKVSSLVRIVSSGEGVVDALNDKLVLKSSVCLVDTAVVGEGSNVSAGRTVASVDTSVPQLSDSLVLKESASESKTKNITNH